MIAMLMIARLLRTPVYPVISMMLSVLVWKPALASLRAKKVRSPDPAPKVKADAPLAVKFVGVRRLAIVVDAGQQRAQGLGDRPLLQKSPGLRPLEWCKSRGL